MRTNRDAQWLGPAKLERPPGETQRDSQNDVEHIDLHFQVFQPFNTRSISEHSPIVNILYIFSIIYLDVRRQIKYDILN